MRHTSGLAYAALSATSRCGGCGATRTFLDENQTNAEMVAKLARLPLMFEPGTTWEYSMSTDVLGSIIEGFGYGTRRLRRRAHHRSARHERYRFGWRPASRRRRLAEMQADPATGKRPAMPYSEAARERRWHSGGGGMVSTAADYLPLLPDAAQRRRARRGAHPRAEDGRADDGRPPAARRGLWSGVTA